VVVRAKKWGDQMDNRKTKRKEAMKVLQGDIQTQMALNKAKVEKAKVEHRLLAQTTAGGGGDDDGVLDQNGSVADSLGGRPELAYASSAAATAELAAEPDRVKAMMMHAKRSVTGGPIKAKAKPVSSGELLQSLRHQITHKASAKQLTKDRLLVEERRYLDHVSTEMDMYMSRRKADSLDKQRTLLAAWERDGHIRNLQKMHKSGPRAIRQYATEHIMGESGKGLLVTKHGDRPGTGRSVMSVGFDSRDAHK